MDSASQISSDSAVQPFREGTIYTFYSYKGGVGRSMALANVAALLARVRKRCLVVDWDLEAPGIEKYFEAGSSRLEGSSKDTPGMLDLILAHQDPLDWNDCLLTAHPFEQGESLSIISAGQRRDDYIQTVQELDWGRLFEEGLGSYLETLRTEWVGAYDFVLIDSRTGITDIGGICTALLPDVLVLFFTANTQSLDGVIEVMHLARAVRRGLPTDKAKLIAVPVPGRDEFYSEYDMVEQWRAIFAEKLEPFYHDWIPRKMTPSRILNKLYIPYIAKWSFGERLPVVEEKEKIEDPRSISASYAGLATLLANQLDWNALRERPIQLEIAEDQDKDIIPVWRRQPLLIAAFAVAMVVIGIFIVQMLPAWNAGIDANRIVTAAVTSNDPLVSALLIAELSDVSVSESELDTLRRIAAERVPHTLIRGEQYTLIDVGFAANGDLVVAVCDDDSIRVWFANGTGRPLVLAGPAQNITDAVLSHDGSRVLTVSDNTQFQVSRLGGAGGPPTAILTGDGRLRSASFSAEGRRVVAISTDGTLEAWIFGETDLPLVMRNGGWTDAAYEPSGRRFVAGSRSGEVSIWVGDESLRLVNLAGHQDWVTSVAFNQDGTHVVTASRDGTARVWQADGRGEPVVLEGHTDWVSSAAFNLAGTLVVTASQDGTARVWRADEKGAPVVLSGHTDQVTHAAFDPSGRRVVTASRDGTVRLWQLDGSENSVLRGHTGGVARALFSPDGSNLLTVSQDGAARVWEVDVPALDPDLDLAGLVAYSRNLTTACLTRDERVVPLSETSSVAERAFNACEEVQGRGPTADSPSTNLLINEYPELLSGFRIVIYYREDDLVASERAVRIEQIIARWPIGIQVVQQPQPLDFFQEGLSPDRDEIRYEEKSYVRIYEEEHARELKSFLEATDSTLNLTLVEVTYADLHTPGRLTIFVWNEE